MEALAETISQILDAANKAGVGFRQAAGWQAQVTGKVTTSAVTYVLEDASTLRMRAIEDCLARVAKVKDTLAKSGVSPGELVGIGYRQSGKSGSVNPWMMTMLDGGSKPDSATSKSPHEITVRTSLTLRFSVKK